MVRFTRGNAKNCGLALIVIHSLNPWPHCLLCVTLRKHICLIGLVLVVCYGFCRDTLLLTARDAQNPQIPPFFGRFMFATKEQASQNACMLVMVNQARHWRLHVADFPPTNENMAFACWLIARDSQKTNLHYFGPACLLRCNIFLVGPCFLVNHARNRLLAVDYFPLLPRRATLRKACVLCCFTVYNPRNLFVSGPSELPSFEAPIVIE